MFMKVSVFPNEKMSNFWRMHTRKFLVMTFSGLLTIFLSRSVYGQTNIRVRGRVVNDLNQPVQRPSVSVKGTTSGVTGDDNGDFEISAPANGTLVISAVDYTIQEVRINNRTTIN